MAGVTDQAFRMLCKKFGADVIYTEFASANALVYGSKQTEEMIAFREEERPVVCQIFGSEPDMMAKAASRLEELKFDGIDINFGCPAYKVVKHGGGVCLMRNLPLVREIVSRVCDAVTIPVSIKIRGSIKTEDKSRSIHALELVDAIKDLPVSALMIHGRSFEKPFDGTPNLETISEVVKAFPGVVLANGGIHSPEDAKKMLEVTHAAGLGIARGAWGSPWIFEDVKQFLKTGNFEKRPLSFIYEIMLEHARLAQTTKGTWGLIELRKHLVKYVKGIPDASALRQRLVQTKTIEEIASIISETKSRA